MEFSTGADALWLSVGNITNTSLDSIVIIFFSISRH